MAQLFASGSGSEFTTTISREEMAQLPIRRYQGEVCVVETSGDLARAQADLLAESIVGFDTETRPAFNKGEHHLPCLVQVATARAVYLFPLRRPEVFPVIAGLLAAARVVKVGIGLAEDLRLLKQVFSFHAANVFDPGSIARRRGMEQSGLRNLAGIFLGFRIPKGKQTSNWAAAHLSQAQITYAATDAWACRELYLHYQASGMIE